MLNKVVFVLACCFMIEVLLIPKVDAAPGLTQEDFSLLTQAVECLSIKASLSEKKNFITSTYLDVAVIKSLTSSTPSDRNIIKKQIILENDDFKNILNALKKYCPNTTEQITYKYQGENVEIFLELLQNYVTTMTVAEIVGKDNRAERFEANYKAFGLDISPY
jgi:hypothetical protein